MTHHGPAQDDDLDALVADAVSLVRDWLGMEIAYTSEITDAEQIIGSVDGDAASFSLGPGTRIPLADSYCDRMLAGVIPSVVPDAAQDPCLADLPATADSRIGAYVGVPIVLPGSGRLYGTLCCLSHEPKADLGEQQLRFVRLVARLIASEIERDRREALALNENVVQQLSLAVYSLEDGNHDAVRDQVASALADARRVATEMLGQPGPGLLRR